MFRSLFFFAGLLLCGAPALSAQANAAAGILYICPPCGAECDAREYSGPGACAGCGMRLIRRDRLKNVAIFIHDGVEVLDFSGPGEVFAAARSYAEEGGFRVFTVGVSHEPILSQGFVRVTPEYAIDDCPRPDIIVLPGGGVGPLVRNPKVVDWVRTNAADDQIVMSVCTGAFLLQAAGRLDGKKATTWHGAIDDFKRRATKTEVLENVRWVDNGNVITTAGVSAGIDGALHLVERLFGVEAAQNTARYMEYDKWNPKDGLVVSDKIQVVKYLSLAWSPDGKKLAFSAIEVGEDWSGFRPDAIRLCVLDITTGAVSRVADGATFASFAPGGCRLAYQKTVDGNTDIYVTDLCSGQVSRLTDDPAKDAAPSWSPDGKRLTFNSDRSGAVEVHVMNAEGSAVEQLTHSGGFKSYNPVWSPRGDAIAYYLEKGDDRDQIYLTDDRGSYHRNVTQDSLHSFYPSWTPAGELLFSVGKDTYLMRTDGAGRRKVEGITGFFARMAPDGKHIAFAARDGRMYVLPWPEGQAQPLVTPDMLEKVLE